LVGGLGAALAAVVLVGTAAFAVATARARARLRQTLDRQRLLVSVAELPEPGAGVEETVARVTDLLVPRLAAFAAVDAVRGDGLVRLGAKGDEDAERKDGRLETPLRTRGRETGRLTIAVRGSRQWSADDRELMTV